MIWLIKKCLECGSEFSEVLEGMRFIHPVINKAVIFENEVENPVCRNCLGSAFIEFLEALNEVPSLKFM